jgi:hypothetical protein
MCKAQEIFRSSELKGHKVMSTFRFVTVMLSFCRMFDPY